MSGISCFRTLLPISTLALLGMLACGEGATEPSMESSMSPQTSNLRLRRTPPRTRLRPT